MLERPGGKRPLRVLIVKLGRKAAKAGARGRAAAARARAGATHCSRQLQSPFTPSFPRLDGVQPSTTHDFSQSLTPRLLEAPNLLPPTRSRSGLTALGRSDNADEACLDNDRYRVEPTSFTALQFTYQVAVNPLNSHQEAVLRLRRPTHPCPGRLGPGKLTITIPLAIDQPRINFP